MTRLHVQDGAKLQLLNHSVCSFEYAWMCFPSTPDHHRSRVLLSRIFSKKLLLVEIEDLYQGVPDTEKVYFVTILGHIFEDVWKSRFDSSLFNSTFISIFLIFLLIYHCYTLLYITATPYYSSCVSLVHLFKKITTIKKSSDLWLPHCCWSINRFDRW